MKIFLSSLVHYIPSQPAGACKQESLLGMDVITILVFSLLICVNFSVPGQPRNLHANVLSPNRIEVSWSPPTDYADIRSYIVYFNDSFARQAVHRVIQPPTNNYILEELIPDTVYHIQVNFPCQKI
jgi:hypothetical protein